jgi:hypothetical protein
MSLINPNLSPNQLPPPGRQLGAAAPRVNRQSSPKFGGSGSFFSSTYASQFLTDILGVWVPKIPLTRSKTQFWEDAFLEWVENVAFYFVVPFGAPVVTEAIKKLNGLGHLATKDVGSSRSELAKRGITELSRDLLGVKAGAVLGVVTMAGCWEYLVQFGKNVMSAEGFGTKNFAAVAGLESAKSTAQNGEMDPVTKAKRRAWQVGGILLGGLTLAAAMPKLVRNSSLIESAAKSVLKYLNFGSNEKKELYFDLTKPLLATFAGIGAVSYIDAARDHLERKETAFRLALVIPYMLAGKELAGNLLAKIFENTKVEIEGESKKIKKVLEDYYKGTDLHPSFLKGGSLWKQFSSPETRLNLGMVKDSLSEEFAKAAAFAEANNKPVLSKAVEEAIYKQHGRIGIGSYLLSALLCGIGINWMAYRQTKHRYELQQQQQRRTNAPAKPQVLASPFVTNAGFSGQPVRPQSPFGYATYPPRLPQQRVPVGYPSPAVGFKTIPNYAWPTNQRLNKYS